jgi:L-cystine transport system permease protein
MELLRILAYIPRLLPYLIYTLEFVLLSLLFGSILGFLLAVAKLRKNRILKSIAYGYTTVLRCTPSIVLLFLVFYGLPPLVKSLFGIDIESMSTLVFVVITFTLFLSASLSEVMRSSYEAVNKGQFEAAVTVGLSEIQAFKRIILPQAFSVAIPNLGNTILYLIKEGALGYIIGFIDVMGKAYLINANEMGGYVLQIYLALSLIYWPVSIIIERVFKRLDNRFSIEH